MDTPKNKSSRRILICNPVDYAFKKVLEQCNKCDHDFSSYVRELGVVCSKCGVRKITQ